MIKIKYYGHSCFVVENSGYSIAIDPYDGVPGYRKLSISANEIQCSHEHGDHAYRAGVKLEKSNAASPFEIKEIHSFHDPKNGALRGPNIIRIFEADGIRVAHLGDIGCVPAPDQIELLKNLDAVMAPIGGTYTFDAKEERDFLAAINPKVIIPMHYKNDEVGYGVLGSLGDFTSLYDSQIVHKLGGNEIEISKDSDSGIFVLKYID